MGPLKGAPGRKHLLSLMTIGNSEKLLEFFQAHSRLVVLGGAGLSAASGIPTYRSDRGAWQRSEPIYHVQFVNDKQQQKRYWARSFMGWPLVRDARPNPAHHALFRLEQLGKVELLITQNVDRLHQRAGSKHVLDLHGRLDKVMCLACKRRTSRELLQQRIATDNPQLIPIQAEWLPDGDADVPLEYLAGFKIPRCDDCTGKLMPDVVFFGGTVPRARVQAGMEAIERADALLVVGSSLQVFSGFRFCRHAVALEKPLALVNPGVTRADKLATVKLACRCGDLLSSVSETLQATLPVPGHVER